MLRIVFALLLTAAGSIACADPLPRTLDEATSKPVDAVPDRQALAEELTRLSGEIAAFAKKSAAELTKLDQATQQLMSWLGVVLNRTADMEKREIWQSEAKFLAPEFSDAELKLLNRWELSTEPYVPQIKDVAWDQVGALNMSKPKLRDASGDFSRYTPWGSDRFKAHTGQSKIPTVRTNPTLPKLALKIEDRDTQFPLVRVKRSWWRELFGSKLENVYFEFDLSPEFNSPHVWRYPPLVPSHAVSDASSSDFDFTGLQGQTYHLFTSTLRQVTSDSSFRVPFRISAMGYRRSQSNVTFADFVKTAKLLQLHLSGRDKIAEVYNFSRMNYVWGGNTIEIAPIDVFRAGIAACGGINDMMGAMLEIGGLRYRGVGGFHPVNRVFYPGGGHTAVEVHDGETWSYLDAFLDLYVPGTAAWQFGSVRAGAFTLTNHKHTSANYRKAMGIADTSGGMPVRDLFKYRIYADKAGRQGMAYMMQLKAAAERQLPYENEWTYGLKMPLRKTDIAFDPETDLSDEVTIHVRARYINSTCRITPYQQQEKCSDPNAEASEWAMNSFTIRPKDLLRKDKAASAAADGVRTGKN